MPRTPEIHVPLWQRLASGLIVPSTVAAAFGARTGLSPDLPPDLAPPVEPVAILNQLPTSADQMLARPTEDELGLTPSDLDYLVREAMEVPFEPAMLAIARLAAAIWHIERDGEAQIRLARGFFDDAAIVDRLAEFVRMGERRVVFSEQEFFVVQRLLVDHARDGAIDEGMTEAEFVKLRRLVIGATTIVDQSHRTLEDGTASAEEMLVYLVQNGAYHSRVNMLNAFARAYSLFVEGARAMQVGAPPLDQWVLEDYRLSLDEQFAAGFAMQTLAKATDETVSPGERSLVEPDGLRNSPLRDRMDDVRAMLASTRPWYRDAFAGNDSLTAIAWETTPFMQRPFLELSSGQLVLISPRSIISWLSDGFYYRLLDSARRRNASDSRTSHTYTAYVGELLEAWALDVVRSSYPGNRPVGGGRVFGEQVFANNQRTPDIAVDLGPDLVLIEVRSGYLKRDLRVNGDVGDLRSDLERVLFSKARQLGDRIADLLEGRATLPDVDIATVDRVWPILVTADITQTEPLHDLVDASLPEIYRDARVQSPLVCEAEDLELLMGIVEGGVSLTDILDHRQRGIYRKLELKRWVFEDPASPGQRRPTYALERWARVRTAVLEVLQLEA